MIKIFLFVLFSSGVFAQHIDYESLSDEQIQSVLQKELHDMENRGATPDLIWQKFVVDADAYIQSREAYYRFVVHTEFMIDKVLAIKMQNGTDQPSDFEMVRKYKALRIQNSYQDYIDHKKTDVAREAWENSTQDGILKLMVEDHAHYSQDEQKRYDGLIILLNMDSYFTHLTITDGENSKIIMPKIN